MRRGAVEASPPVEEESLEQSDDTVEVELPGEEDSEESEDSEDVREIPEETQPQVENESAGEAEEVPEEAVRDYSAEAGIPLEIGTSYAIEDTLGKTFTFTPEEDGRYLVEKNLDEDDKRIYVDFFQGDERAGQIQGTVHKVKKGKPCTLKITSNKDDVTGTWKIISLQPQAAIEGEKYTYSYEDYAYYTFVPEESGPYKMNMHCTDEWMAMIQETGTNQYETVESDHPWSETVDLAANTQYEIYFRGAYGQRPDNPVSWKLISLQPQAVTEEEQYTYSYEDHAYYTFVPEESGKYKMNMYGTNEWGAKIREAGTDRSLEYLGNERDANTVDLVANTQYEIYFFGVYSKTLDTPVFWKIISVQPQAVTEGEKYTHSCEDHAYYTFVPEESGTYRLSMYSPDEWRAGIREVESDQYYEEIIYSRNVWYNTVDLVANTQYEIDFWGEYGEEPDSTISWRLGQVQDVTVTEGTEYKDTADLLPRYTFECKEEGEYRIDLIDRNSSIRPRYFEKWDVSGEQIEESVTVKAGYGDLYYVKLEANTKYDILFYRSANENPEATFTWKIRKLSEKELVLGAPYTFPIEDAIRYKFSPMEDGLYQLTYDEGLGCDLYSEKTGYMVNKYWRGNSKVYYLKAGETYRFEMEKSYGQEDEVTEWKFQMTKMSEKTIDADQVYQRQENEPVYYRFKAKTAGRYLINDGVEVFSTKIFSDSWYSHFGSPIFLDMANYGRTLTDVPLEQGEEIVLLAFGENKSVCISPVKNVDGFEYIWHVDGTVAIRGYSGEEKNVVIPDEIDGKPVTWILSGAFVGSDIESVVLPSALKEITMGAFARTNIESVVLPSTLEKIGENAFSGTKLKEIVIPDSVTDIGGCAFYNCGSLKKVVIGSGLEKIRGQLFEDCDSLEEVVMPGNGSVTRIEYYVFSGCTSLSKITFPNTIESCHPTADFESTAWYKNLPDGEVYIGKLLLTHKGTVPKGTKVTVKPGTAFINEHAYGGQTGVSEVILPYGVKKIGICAFVCGDDMKSIVIPASVTEIGSLAFGYKAELSENGNYYDYKKLDDFVIYGQKGTAAEEYAIEYGFEFVEKTTFARGDVDLSGKVDISDLRLMLRAVCGKVTLAPDQIAAGDITGSSDSNNLDGKITIADLRRLLRFICGKIEAL